MNSDTVPIIQESPNMNGQLLVSSDQSVESDTDSLVNVETDDKFINETLEEEMYLGADPSDGVIFQYSSDEEQAVPHIWCTGSEVIVSSLTVWNDFRELLHSKTFMIWPISQLVQFTLSLINRWQL